MTTDKNMHTNPSSIKKNMHPNPSSIKTKFAFRFVRVMKILMKKTRLQNKKSTADYNYERHLVIKSAAYTSMASAVGPRRAWSRAVLRKIRNRKLGLVKKSGPRNHHVHFCKIRRKRVVMRRNPTSYLSIEQENDLRELVPGGEEMDFSKLLRETAHYVTCLRAQVQVMKKIVDYYSK